MPNLNKYKSREDEVNDHATNYRSAGGFKGKFLKDSPDKYRIEKIVEEVRGGDIVLDIGCNDGCLGLLLNKKGALTYGIDVVEQLVNLAINRGVLAEVGNAEDIRFPKSMFDVVVMAEVMEHLYKPTDALSEICRVLKPSGKFVGSVPHDKGGLGIGKKADYHNWVFTREELEKLLDKYFKSVTITETVYSESASLEYNVSKTKPQWYNWVCRGIKHVKNTR